jgi:hypothetical protein
MSGENGKTRTDSSAEGALAALRRARLRAERLALTTGTCLVVAVDGMPVRVQPCPAVADGVRDPVSAPR